MKVNIGLVEMNNQEVELLCAFLVFSLSLYISLLFLFFFRSALGHVTQQTTLLCRVSVTMSLWA